MWRNCLLACGLWMVAGAASADWRATTPQAQAAARQPRIAAAIEAAARLDEAVLRKDVATFASLLADDAVIHNPFNRVVGKADAVRNMQAGLIDYASLERAIDYAAERGDHEVLLMGEEALAPLGQAKFAGKTVRRRTTELWTDADGRWRLVLRQATIYEAR